MQTWRWDQGRLDYFKFNNIVNMAVRLDSLNGMPLDNSGVDPLRQPLTQTGLPFAPMHYRVWRNYKRVFECNLLATKIGGALQTTEICRKLAQDAKTVNVDEYMALFAPRFCYPFPAFDDFSPTIQPVFPVCVILKYLLACSASQKEESISLSEVFSYLIGNSLTGYESILAYASLTASGYIPTDTERRQVRELLAVFSQFSFLKWKADRLYLDVLPGDLESIEAIKAIAEPFPLRQRLSDKERELLELGRYAAPPTLTLDTVRRQPSDVVFTEGKRVPVAHQRIERSPYLRQWLFRQLQQPYICDMCGLRPKLMYPWTDNILEVHHLLPLSSSLDITSKGTSLLDVVAICPNCHRSVHFFYKQWLNERQVEDFTSKAEALSVYNEAKAAIRR